MRVSFKYLGQAVFMDDTGPVVCSDDLTREILEEAQSVEAFRLAGDVTQSPVFNVIQRLGDDVTDLDYVPTDTIH
jgi:hypothetical protein